jgi:hypothetical protein
MSKISKKLDEFVDRQGIVSAEFCKLVDQVEELERRLPLAVEALEEIAEAGSCYHCAGPGIAERVLEKIKDENRER